MGIIWNPHGVLRGDRSGEACFTTLLVGATLPQTWPHHMARLQRDAAVLGLQVPELDGLGSELTSQATGVQRARVELVAHGGSPLLGAPCDTAVRLHYTDLQYDHTLAPPVTLQPLASSKGQPGPLSLCKLPQMAEHWLLRRQAEAAGFGDALLTTQDGWWCEASTANLLIGLQDDTVVTPGPRATPLPGTTLAALRERVPVRDADIDTNTPIRWMILLNAAWGGRPVAAVAGQALAEPPSALLALARELTWPAS